MIGIEDVFDARTASGGNSPSARRNTSSFTAASSTTASIRRSAGTSCSAGSMRSSTPAGSGPPFSASLDEALLHRLERAVDRAGHGVVKRHAASRRGHDLRDAAAHLAGADDEHVLELQIVYRRAAGELASAVPGPAPDSEGRAGSGLSR